MAINILKATTIQFHETHKLICYYKKSVLVLVITYFDLNLQEFADIICNYFDYQYMNLYDFPIFSLMVLHIV